MMLASLVVRLSPKKALQLKGRGGEALHGLLMSILDLYSPYLAVRVHEAPEPKPFTLSPLLGDVQLSWGRALLSPPQEGYFHITLLTNWAVTEISKALFQAIKRELELSSGTAVIKGVEFSSSEEVRSTTYEELWQNAEPGEEIILEFLSPTSFHHGGKEFLFPEPRSVFSSLLRKWNAFSERKFEAPEWETILVSKYNLRTELVHFSSYKMVGFKGRVSFLLPEGSSEQFKRVANCLANFAFFAGTGAKTTMGMGQTRRI